MPVGTPPTFTLDQPDQSSLTAIRDWRTQQFSSQFTNTTLIPLDEVPGWDTRSAGGELSHKSGRFFTVRGLEVRTPDGTMCWTQPVIDQPEVGLLGIAVSRNDRGVSVLIQAKAEPGNINGVQLSPTVQATQSNQRRVHGGKPVPYLELFNPDTADILADTRQSEHGAVFWRKRNRVMIVQTARFEPQPGFRWIQLSELLCILADNDLVHADTRAVLACMPWLVRPSSIRSDFVATLLRSVVSPVTADALRPIAQWMSSERTERSMTTRPVELAQLHGWSRHKNAISRDDGTGFEVVAVAVEAGGREVNNWAQPMVRPRGVGLIGLMVDGVGPEFRVLLQLRAEAGLVDGAELGPTVQVAGGDLASSRAEAELYDAVLATDGANVVFDSILSDEGGRFLAGRHRHKIALTEWFDPPPGYRWCSLGVLTALLIHSHQVNMQLRSILVCLMSLASRDE